ncbi:hypothetical protein RHO15_03625 [Utexia brackfieldae]|uniref:transcriptional antiterminator n=1 Tax=Utexia brackfieldae TaxID=3074108 RepID=UPI00370DC42C
MDKNQFRMIADDLALESTTTQVIKLINQWFVEEGITQNEIQQMMLQSHIRAMVERAKTLEQLPEVDPQMFEEISPASMTLARRTVSLFDTLSMAEAYLLAVHYEVARNNLA